MKQEPRSGKHCLLRVVFCDVISTWGLTHSYAAIVSHCYCQLVACVMILLKFLLSHPFLAGVGVGGEPLLKEPLLLS